MKPLKYFLLFYLINKIERRLYMKIFVGNLSYQVTEEELRQEFMAFGTVNSVSIVTDRYDNRPKGFAFIEMPAKSEAEAAISGLNGKMLGEKGIMVNESRPKSETRGPISNQSSFNDRGSFGGRQGSRPGGRFGGKGRSNKY
jgi:RNA recognition motif-containing protein